MRKFNWLDAVIILLILAVGFVGFKYLKNKTAVSQTTETKTLFFTFETPQGPIEIAENIKENTEVIFGEKKIAKGVITKKEILPYEEKVENTLDGVFYMQQIPGKYRAILTIEFEGAETENAYKCGDEQLNIGQQMIVSGLGINSTGIVIGVGGVE